MAYVDLYLVVTARKRDITQELDRGAFVLGKVLPILSKLMSSGELLLSHSTRHTVCTYLVANSDTSFSEVYELSLTKAVVQCRLPGHHFVDGVKDFIFAGHQFTRWN